MWRQQRESIGTSDSTTEKACKYSPARLPCVVSEEPDRETCRACLKAMIERDEANLCPTCGGDAYRDFRFTGKPHLCPDVKLNSDGQVI